MTRLLIALLLASPGLFAQSNDAKEIRSIEFRYNTKVVGDDDNCWLCLLAGGKDLFIRNYTDMVIQHGKVINYHSKRGGTKLKAFEMPSIDWRKVNNNKMVCVLKRYYKSYEGYVFDKDTLDKKYTTVIYSGDQPGYVESIGETEMGKLLGKEDALSFKLKAKGIDDEIDFQCLHPTKYPEDITVKDIKETLGKVEIQTVW